MGARKNFWDSLTMPTATFLKIFHGLLFRWIPWMCVQNLKSVALPDPDIVGSNQKIWAVPGYAHAAFSPKCVMGFCSNGPYESIAGHAIVQWLACSTSGPRSWVRAPAPAAGSRVATVGQLLFAPSAWAYSTLRPLGVGKWVPAMAGKV